MSNWESNVRSAIWHNISDFDEQWAYRGKSYDNYFQAMRAQEKYEMAEQDHADNIRKGEE